ncbi:hypothetical protein MMC32_002200 [Xylographa parallela]|nr:hypothetical protein [Xylographa parallela]
MSSPFLALPREIRNEIYRNLLLTSRISLDDFPHLSQRKRFILHTAILLVNRQISAEAAVILYDETDFVWVHLEFVSARRHGWAFNTGLQRFRRAPNVDIQPVLNVRIDALDAIDEKARPDDQDLYWLTTVDGLSSFCESVYLIDAPYPWLVPLEAPLNQLSVTLELSDEMPTKKSKLLRSLEYSLDQFRFLHGFGEFFVLGIVDKELDRLLQDVWRHVKHGPFEDTAKKFIETCDRRSKEQYALGQYRTAKAYCMSLMLYRNYLRILLDSGHYNFDHTIPGLISHTWTKAMEAGLTNVKSNLRLGDTTAAKMESWDNRWWRKGGWGGKDEDPTLILKMKFLLCTSIGEFFEKSGEGKDALMEAVALIAAEPRYAHRAEALLQEFERVEYRYAAGSDELNHSLLEVYWSQLEVEESEESEED